MFTDIQISTLNYKRAITISILSVASALLCQYCMASEQSILSTLCIVLPGITFGLALSSGYFKQDAHPWMKRMALVGLMIGSWGFSFAIALLLIKILPNDTQPVIHFLIIGIVSGFTTFLLANLVITFQSQYFIAVLSVLFSITAFGVFYFLKAPHVWGDDRLSQLFIIWQPLMGFALGLDGKE